MIRSDLTEEYTKIPVETIASKDATILGLLTTILGNISLVTVLRACLTNIFRASFFCSCKPSIRLVEQRNCFLLSPSSLSPRHP